MSAKQKGQFVINDISMSSNKEGQENLSNTDMSKKNNLVAIKSQNTMIIKGYTSQAHKCLMKI